ncbi:MAG: PIG-L family deacetylase [Bacillota bacterium]
MENEKSIVYIGAHQDDIVAVAGTLIKLRKKGYKIYEFCLTLGQKGGDDPNIIELRVKEEEKVCELIGAELKFFDQMDGELFAGEEICKAVADELACIKPAAVITMWALEKPDHAAAFAIAHRAMHLADLYWTTEFYMNMSDESGYKFDPEIYVNVDSEIDIIQEIVKSYPSMMSPESAEMVIRRKSVYGLLSWCNYAEGFKTALPLVNERWNRKTEVGRILLNL